MESMDSLSARHALTRNPMKSAVLFLGTVASLGSAAAAEPWVKEALKSLPQHHESVIRPGCLLPEPSVLSRAPLPRAVLYISVDTEGKVEPQEVLRGTGDPAVDSAIAAAAAECKFEPTYTIAPVTGERTRRKEFRELVVQWPVPVPTWGAHLCFSPEYPHALRRSEAQGIVTVLATKPAAGAAPDLKVVEPSSARSELRRLTLEVVAACFAHQRTHADMPVQRNFEYRYQWVLQ